MQSDIIISGGSLSASAAALQAARTNPAAEILLIEPTDWLGGQATSQGVSAIDNAWHEPGRSLMLNSPRDYYPHDYLDFLEQIKNAPESAPGERMAPDGSAWVSRQAFDPRTAAWVLDNMIARHANITVLKMTVLKNVVTTTLEDPFGRGQRIDELTLVQRVPLNGYKPFTKFLSHEIRDWYHPEPSEDFDKILHTITPRDEAKGLVVIDASELGDAIIMSGAAYTVGRELQTEAITPDGTLPDMDESGTQSFAFSFCITDAPRADDEAEIKKPFPAFHNYYRQQCETYFSMQPHNWKKIWTYRRLKNTGSINQIEQVNRGDVSMQNWFPGNDYPYGTMLRNRREAAAEAQDWYGGIKPDEIARAEMHALAWYFYMKEHRTTMWDTRLLRDNDALNMMGTASGLSKFPYIRGTRRIVGLHNFRITENTLRDTLATDYDGGTSLRFHDSVGIGNYAVDIHPTNHSQGISPSLERPAPFYIPYRSLGSANVRNLLASGKTAAQTYLTNAAYRLHPIEWAFGSAAGAAAAIMSRNGLANYELLEPEQLRELQHTVATNSPISWAAFDSDFPPRTPGAS